MQTTEGALEKFASWRFLPTKPAGDERYKTVRAKLYRKLARPVGRARSKQDLERTFRPRADFYWKRTAAHELLELCFVAKTDQQFLQSEGFKEEHAAMAAGSG